MIYEPYIKATSSDEHLIKTLISKWNIKCIYHFTAKENLDSIMKHGILSLEKMQASNLNPSVYVSNDWSRTADKHRGLSRYVHLSFTNTHPMAYLKNQEGIDIVYLKINPDILLLPNVKFSAGISNKAGVIEFDESEFESKIDCESLFCHTDWTIHTNMERRKTAEKTEILVPDKIPPTYILKHD